MEFNIKDIQDTVTIYTNILAQIIKMDVTIVDSQLNRISISKKSRIKEINTNVSEEGHILKKAIESGLTQVVTSPREDEICADCASREQCGEAFHMCTPILVKGNAIGAIAFVCCDQKSRKRALHNQAAYSQFLRQFADLIAAKAVETAETSKNESMLNLLETVIDHIDTGVIIFGMNNDVIRMNAVASRILKIHSKHTITFANLTDTGIDLLDRKLYTLNLNGKVYSLAGKSFELKIYNCSRVFVFQTADRLPAVENASPHNTAGVNRIIGKSQSMMSIKKYILTFANSRSPILITGESGTEKNMIALALHEESDRSESSFVSVNCTIVPAAQIVPELFGTTPPERSSGKGRVGKIEAAAKGTLLIEEIGNLELDVQAQLLATLETNTVTRAGGNKKIRVNTRIIVTSSKDLSLLVKKGEFLEELYYKLKVLPVYVPPVRERGDDIVLLAQRHIQKYAKQLGKSVQSVKSDFWERLEQYSWPGNVWELKNTIEYVIHMMSIDGMIDASLLPVQIYNQSELMAQEDDWSLKNMEKRMIQKALLKYGDTAEAKEIIAEKLEIGIATLYRKLKKYGL